MKISVVLPGLLQSTLKRMKKKLRDFMKKRTLEAEIQNYFYGVF